MKLGGMYKTEKMPINEEIYQDNRFDFAGGRGYNKSIKGKQLPK